MAVIRKSKYRQILQKVKSPQRRANKGQNVFSEVKNIFRNDALIKLKFETKNNQTKSGNGEVNPISVCLLFFYSKYLACPTTYL